MNTTHTNQAKPTDFTDILDTLDDAPVGASASRAADRDEVPESQIAPATVSQSKSWLLQLLGSMAMLRTGARGLVQPAASPYVEDFSEELAKLSNEEEQGAISGGLHLAINEQDAIAEELGLAPDLSEAELKQIRRTFAKQNHPDRLLPEGRIDATRRMTIANMLIDQLLKKKTAAH